MSALRLLALVLCLSAVLFLSRSDSPPSVSQTLARDSSAARVTTVKGLNANASWTNDTMVSELCQFADDELIALTIYAPARSWLMLPPCMANWTKLSSIRMQNIQRPNMEMLPKSLNSLTIDQCTEALVGALSATLDWSALRRMPSLTTLSITNSGYGGTLPPCISSNFTAPNINSIDLSGNALSGTIPANFFSCSPTLSTLTIPLNGLQGTIPWFGFQQLTWLSLSGNQLTHWPPFDTNPAIPNNGAPTKLMKVDVSNNPLVVWPSDADFESMSSLNALLLTCLQNGPKIAPRTSPITNATQLSAMASLVLAYCPIIGSLPDMPQPNPIVSQYSAQRSFNFELASISGTIPESWRNYSFYALNLGGNIGINGTLPQLFGFARPDSGATSFASFGRLGYLTLYGTSLSGNWTINQSDYFPGFWDMLARITVRDMTQMNFCSEESGTWTAKPPQLTCDMANTNASLCQEKYSILRCTMFPTPPSPPPSQQITCPGPSPSNQFSCLNGVWTTFAPVTTPSIVVPPNAQIVVKSDFNASHIDFNGLEGSIVISACPDHLTSISFDLSASDIDTINKKGTLSKLVLSSPNCQNGPNPSSISVSVTRNNDKRKCQKVKSSLSSNNESKGLVVLFKTDSSSCNTWWIILVSVLCGVILVAIIVLVLVFTLSTEARECVRPFARRKRALRTTAPR